MALSARLQQLSALVSQLGAHPAEAPRAFDAPSALASGFAELDGALPDGGFTRGAVIELAIAGGAALGTSIALAVCRAAQQEAVQRGGKPVWCAFVDPSSTLYAPGVAHMGVAMQRLLVVRPALEALSRVVVRIAESQAFAVVVIDTVGVPGCSQAINLGTWPRIVRRLSMAVDGTPAIVLLVTDRDARRPLPLPVAQRIELSRAEKQKLVVWVVEDRRGRIGGHHTLSIPSDDRLRTARLERPSITPGPMGPTKAVGA